MHESLTMLLSHLHRVNEALSEPLREIVTSLEDLQKECARLPQEEAVKVFLMQIVALVKAYRAKFL
eukprot:m.17167 g.17167  ORF g.17167 m.17167 type:complete len:66 (+) comp3215_c0_seq1:718-915(+)